LDRHFHHAIHLNSRSEFLRPPLRAYISIEPEGIRYLGDGTAEITVLVKNTGQTPALEVEIASYVACIEDGHIERVVRFEDFPQEDVQRLFSIPSGGFDRLVIPTQKLRSGGQKSVPLIACPRYVDVLRGDPNTGPNVAWVYEGGRFMRPKIDPKQG
jgi:archaellum component FlaG (FlaF/FlaG flagellin family)